jgi:hypothetical protein
MANKIGLTIGAAAVALAAVALPPQAQAQNTTKIGVLTCNVSSGWGFIFGSSRGLRCEFSPAPGKSERYAGTINKFGVDIGYLQGGVIVWAVLAPSSTEAPGALAGAYGGATGSAAVGAGAGANVLIGGMDKSFTLQPVSFEGQSGLNVAGGIAAVTLRYEKP